MLLTQVVSDIGFIGMMLIVEGRDEILNSWMVMYPIYSLFHTLNFRMFLIKMKLKRWQIISLKIVVMTSAIIYFCVAAYMMFVQF